MKVGFTGTRNGMSDEQKVKLDYFIKHNDIEEFHHGDCVGADTEAHNIVKGAKPKIKIIIHPPIMSKYRSFLIGDEKRKPKEPLERNNSAKFILPSATALLTFSFMKML